MIFKFLSLNNSGAALVTQSQMISGNTILLQLTGFNDNAALRYVHLFPFGPPLLGTVPLVSFIVNPKTNFSYFPYVDDNNGGYKDIEWIGSSLTPSTYTPSGTLDLFWSVLYGSLV